MDFISINPATGRQAGLRAAHRPEETERLLARAVRAQHEWKARNLGERLEVLAQVARLLRECAPSLADLMAVEMGKPLAQGRAEAEKCAWVCDDLLARAPRVLADQEIPTEARRSFISRQPLGLVLAVMPWNFPLWQVVRAAAPALAAGNGVLLKHAPTTQGCAEALCDLFREAGLPDGLLPNLRLKPDAIADLIGDPRVAAVTLTGSTAAGRAVAACAGGHLKKCVLELGGSDPAVLLADADLELAARIMVQSRMINNGQSCIASKRFIALEDQRPELEERILALMGDFAMADPREEGCRLGPLARLDLRENLADQVRRSRERGARLLLGGVPPTQEGWWYPATVLSQVAPGMPAFDEELFGPVAALCWARHEEEALELASRTPYGLGASLFTQDRERGEKLAATRLHAGCVCVNALVKSDPRLPFGGVMDSGFGRELGDAGLVEFVNTKSIWID